MGRGTNSKSSRGKDAAAIEPGAYGSVQADAVIGMSGAGEPAQAAFVAQVEASDSDSSLDPQPLQQGARRGALSPEARAQLAEIRSRLEVRVGQLVLMLMNVPRYRHQALSDLNHLIVEPLLRDRIAIAHAKAEEDASGRMPVAGIAIWASVDDKIDAKIKEQVKAGTFPIRLAPDEWASGNSIWLLDVIAPTRKLASNVLVNFGSIAGDRPVQLHPIVAKSVDEKLLEKLKLRQDEELLVV